MRVLRKIERLSEQSGESAEAIVESGVSLFESQARIKMKSPRDTLTKLLEDPKRGKLFQELMAAIRTRSFETLTPAERSARASEGGKARAASLTPAERSAISKAAVEKRWGKKR